MHRHKQATTHLGLAIAKKQIRRAVDRNRLKRLIRESFRHHKAELQGYDIVVMARTKAITTSNAEIFEKLKQHWDAVSSNNKA